MTDTSLFEEDNLDDKGVALSALHPLILDLEGFEGPIDILLQLARDQKVDLTQISILALANQYISFIQQAHELRLELAADYLVMAAWLAYLKSRLLLPEPQSGEEPSGAELAAALKFQLQRLQAMQDAGKRLMARPQLGVDFFARGNPEQSGIVERTDYEVSLFDILKAYANNRAKAEPSSLLIEHMELHSVEEAIKRLSAFLGTLPEWQELNRFLPTHLGRGIISRSAVASIFAASLEMCREGKIELQQEGAFAPIYIRDGKGHITQD
ncbi:ScpA family protein [Kiloniella laminariae]|uniref:Segregation and condensation protein A n=1 Tax=Kiloniella laminariae TaxID=454162 RepID=A0ABT4LNH0_9PROT|nr:ScpA family protein [Kiloniella laminariae]MCZ4282632.1 ScpA family protein [Kiloniella laminariae]